MAYLEQLYEEGDLVEYVVDTQPRVYKVKGLPIFQYNDWWYNFHPTAQGNMDNASEPRLPQAQLVKVNVYGKLWGS